MFIEGTENLNLRTLELPSVKLQIRSGQVLSINEKDYYNHDVQVAVKMGWIVAKDAPVMKMFNTQPDIDRLVECKNTHTRSITVKNHGEIARNAIFNLRESELSSPEVSAAISRGMIQPLKIAGESTITGKTESQISLKKLFKNAQSKKKKKVKKTEVNHEEDKKPVALETNSEINPINVIELEEKEEKEYDNSDMEDKRKTKAVIWNPVNNPIIGAPKPKGQSELDILSIGTKNKDDVKFVDEEEEANRIKSHPVLKNKKTQNNQEINFVDKS